MTSRGIFVVCTTLSALTLGGLCGWLGATSGTWHEELSAYPFRSGPVLEAVDPSAPRSAVRERGCDAAKGRRLVRSSERPKLALCTSARTYPLMITSYASGYPYWPARIVQWMTGGGIFRLRALSVLGAIATMLLTAWLVRRLAGDRLATVTAIACAGCPPLVVSHSVLMQYETLPWSLVCAALLCLTRCPWLLPESTETPPKRSAWFLAAAFLVGLATAVNVKGAMLVGLLILFGIVLRIEWRRVPWTTWLAAAPVALLPASPLAAFAVLDPAGGFGEQVAQRLTFAGGVHLERIAREPLNLGLFWTDTGAFGAELGGGTVSRNWPAIVVALGALVTVLFGLLRGVGTRSGSVALAGGAATIVVGWMLVSILLYGEQRTNYTPLHTVFAVTTASAVVSWADWLGRRVPRARRAALPTVTALVVVTMGINVVRRGSPGASTSLPMNGVAESALVADLASQAHPTDVVYSTTYNLAGVVDALTDGEIITARAHRYLLECHSSDPDAIVACMTSRFGVLLDRADGHTTWVVAPARETRIDEPNARYIEVAARHAAQRRGSRVTMRSFETGAGVPVLRLMRFER